MEAVAAANSSCENVSPCRRALDPDGFDDAELETILREFVGTLIGLLQPRHAEVVWRAEVFDQSLNEIAKEINFSERTVTECLRTGRRALLDPVMLMLQRSSEAQAEHHLVSPFPVPHSR